MITLSQIKKVYNRGRANELVALNGIDLTVARGEFVVVVGSNGSGKSTLLNLIAGSVSPTSGEVTLNETPVTRLAEYQRSKWVARVFQNPLSGTAPDLSILDNFRLAALRTRSKNITIGINGDFIAMVKDKIARLGMGLENKIHQPMGSLSGGQRQALTLPMGVMDDAQILLLDEPTAALDPKSAKMVMQIANGLIKEYGLTALLITHNLKEAREYGQRIIQMSEGKIIRAISSEEKLSMKVSDIYNWFVE